METKENTINESNKVIETLTKELESLNAEELHEFFKFFYKMNHTHGNSIGAVVFTMFIACDII